MERGYVLEEEGGAGIGKGLVGKGKAGGGTGIIGFGAKYELP